MISAQTAGAWNDAQSLSDQRPEPQGMQPQLSEESRHTQEHSHLMRRGDLAREQSAQMHSLLLYAFFMKLPGLLSLGFPLSEAGRKETAKKGERD